MTTQVKEPTLDRELVQQPKQEVSGAESTRPGPVFTPPVDIYETEAAIMIIADMPGVTPAGLDINLDEHVLSIEGWVEPAAGNPGERALLQEFQTGSFRREFRLNKLIDRNGIDASLRGGVLYLTLPKSEQARPRKIEIRQS